MSFTMKNIVAKGNTEAEKYLSLLEQYQNLYKNEKKLTLFYQLGDFYEIYSIEIPETNNNESKLKTKRRGNLWDIASDLDIAIAKKDIKVYNNPNIQVYMGGVGVKSIDKYLNLGVERGWSIILFNQKKLESGSIIRVFDKIISPGMNVDTNSYSNFTMFICLEKITSFINPSEGSKLFVGVSLLDTLTGYVGTMQYPSKEQLYDEVIFDELIKLITIKNPKNIIVYADKCDLSKKNIVDKLHLNLYNHNIFIDEFPRDFTKLNYQVSLFNNIYERLLKNENNKHIFEILGIKDMVYSQYALTALFEYMTMRNQAVLTRIQKPELLFDDMTNLVLQNNSLEQLNIVNNMKKMYHFETRLSLLSLLDKTRTTIGKRIFRNKLMNPITSIKKLKNSYKNIETFIELKDDIKINIIRPLVEITDISKANRKITNYTFKCNELMSFYQSLKNCLVLNENVKNYNFKNVLPTQNNIKKINNLLEYINSTFNLKYLTNNTVYQNNLVSNIFNGGINEELDKIQHDLDMNNNLIDMIIKKLNIAIDPEYYLKKKDKGGTKSLVTKGDNVKLSTYITATKKRCDEIKKVFDKEQTKKGYVMIISNLKLKKKDFTFEPHNKSNYRIDVECIRNSGVNLIRLIKELNEKTDLVFKEVLDNIYSKYYDAIQDIVRFVGEIDVIQSAANIAIENGYIAPIIDESATKSYLDVQNIRHPLIEQLQKDIQYVGNDVILGKDEKNGILLFGVNAVGKSSLMKSIGCCIIMAQSGLFVPASKFLFYPFKYLFTRICSNDNIFAGLSTFEVEMSEMKTILNYANEYGIILGDEICSGTETLDATAIVAASVEELSKKKANFLFATHLHYLANSEYITKLKNVSCKHMSVKFNEKDKCLIYERKLQEGSGPSSYGIEVCKSMGMGEDFMNRTQNIRNTLSDDIQMITGKKSNYNKDKFINKCEVCLNQPAIDTHHIKFQSSADKVSGMIDHWHKDSKFNLVGLCKTCHNHVHSTPPNLEIKGYISTNTGIKLDFEWKNEMNQSIDENEANETNSSLETLQLSEQEEVGNKQQEKVEEHKMTRNELKQLIQTFKNRKLTLRQIQNRLKEINVKMTQKEISGFI